MGTLKILWMLSKKNDTSWIASGLCAAGEGVGVIATAVDVKAVAVVVVVAGVALGMSVALSVIGLLGARINSPDDTRDIGVIVIVHSVPERQRHTYSPNSQKTYW